jgi:1,4-dihydroxy-2-naphthoate octaprenyltransferase
VLVGTAWGAGVAGEAHWTAFALALAAVVCVHAGINVLNDVYDDISGTDRFNDARIFPFTGGSRFIQNEILTRRQMGRWAVLLLGVSVILGIVLIMQSGTGVLMFGLAGMGLGVLYSMPPFQLAARGLGETAVAAGFGVLPVTGAAWLQSGQIDAGALLVSLPVSLWVANILLINEVPDIGADRAAGKLTLAVRAGEEGVRRLYLALNLAALAILLAGAGAGLIPWTCAIVPALLLPLAFLAARTIDTPGERERGIKQTLLIHAAGSIYLAASLAF